MSTESKTKLFGDLVEPLDDTPVTRSTIIGFPCVRFDGAFFASLDHRSGDLIDRLPKGRVTELIEERSGVPFAPAGRTFKEWVSIPTEDENTWSALMAQARAFVAST